jgi:hypothetical protein
MSGEEDNIRFDVKRGRSTDISCQKSEVTSDSIQERKIKSDSITGEGDEMILDLRRGR